MNKRAPWKVIFIGLSIAYLLLSLLKDGVLVSEETVKQLQFIIKPTLITTLAVYFFIATRNQSSRFRNTILLGLLFSVTGDTLLMFADRSANFFLLGLGAFLITHIFYIIAFTGYKKEQAGFVSRNKWSVIPLVIFVASFIALLWEGLDAAMRWPVTVYAIVIGTMAAACLNVKSKSEYPVFLTLMSGALLFMISDSMIALTKFKAGDISIPLAGFWIMLTYLAGQYLIVSGAMRLNQS